MQYNFSERLKSLRKELKLSQTDFGKKIGKNYHSVMRWELGKVVPPPNVLEHICNTFGVSAEWMQNGAGEMFASQSTQNEAAESTVEYQAVQADIPLYSTINAAFDGYAPSGSLKVPGADSDALAFYAAASASPPVSAGDIVIASPVTDAKENGLYIIEDRYGDLTLRWLDTGKGEWLSKRPDYPNLPLSDAAVKGLVIKLLREINI